MIFYINLIGTSKIYSMKNIIIFLSFLFALGSSVAQEQALNLELVDQLEYVDSGVTVILNDIWGYEDEAGDEYAIVGLRTGVSIVALDYPGGMKEVVRIPGPTSVWRDIKTYGDYAFVVHDALSSGESQGLLIIDLRDIENGNAPYFSVYPNQITRAHNIYIDENGIAYLAGADFAKGGAFILDVTNPYDVQYLGMYNEFYLHDCVVRGDTLWGGAIYAGSLVAVDVSDKANTKQIGFEYTPNLFTHNCWFSDNGKTIFTTDEKSNSYVASYDVSDLENIKFLDKIQSIYSELTIPHNTHVYNDYLVNSYYRDGLQIVDAQYPDNLIDVGHYDTSPDYEGSGFNGAWGAYPFLSSKRILVSDMEKGLVVLKPKYTRGSYLHINVESFETGLPLPGAEINLNNIQEIVNVSGELKTGVAVPGNYEVDCHLLDYLSEKIQVELKTNTITELTIKLKKYVASIDDIKLSSLSFGPNPVADEFYLWSDVPVYGSYEIKVYNLMGKLVYSQIIEELDKEKNIINISHLLQGEYIVEMVEKESSKKIVQKIFKM